MNNLIKYISSCLLNISLLLGICLHTFAQTPQPATIINGSPSDQEILDALTGQGLTATLRNGDGLTRGLRTPNSSQVAIFDNGERAALGIDRGVFFSTGYAYNTDPSMGRSHLLTRNEDPLVSHFPQNETHSDPDLTNIFSQAIYDVVIYKFTVKLDDHTSAIRAVFQFGSDEYPDYVGSDYNDTFGFFVRPVVNSTLPGGVPVINMARLPQSDLPISVNTVNYGYVGFEGLPNYPGLDLGQSAHYIVNGHTTQVVSGSVFYNGAPGMNNGPKPVYIEYNGLTKLLTYDLKNLTPGGTYEFKIAIADASDGAFDSGVLIKSIQGTTGADVRIVKTVDNMEPIVGDIVEFTLTADNLGPYDAPNAAVNDLLPSGYEYVSHNAPAGTNYNPVTGQWQLGTLQAIHQKRVLTIRARVKAIGIHQNIATITSDDLDPDYSNNTSSVNPIPVPPCIESYLFLDDFGTSNPNVNFGRATTPYMPLDSYSFGTPYPSGTNSEARIDNGHYAVVSPLYIKDGWDPNDLSNYFWTPGMLDDIISEAGAVTDISGTLSGAALAINTNNDLDVFYQRDQLLDYDDTYRYSFWMYHVEGPTKIAIDIRQKSTGKILGTYATDVFSDTGITKGKWTNVQLYFSIPALQDLDCEIGEVVIELRNDLEQSAGSRFYIDNIGLTQLGATCPEPATPLQIDCPIPPPAISNPMLINRALQ